MSLESIQTKAADLKAALEAIRANRDLWQDEKRQLLIATLQELSRATELGLRVQHVPFRHNQEGVNIHFPDSPSGIVQKGHQATESLMKEGGMLTFSQAYNGEVFVIMAYPFVKDVIGQTENDIDGRYAPQLITREFIEEKFEKFLVAMIAWETSNGRNRIGFTK